MELQAQGIYLYEFAFIFTGFVAIIYGGRGRGNGRKHRVIHIDAREVCRSSKENQKLD